MDVNQKLNNHSNYWYNDGLQRAGIRDMTGAKQSLKKSLKYNRENIAARNLLGLVYFGCGEVVEALVQWIISKNLKASDNIANYYIKLVQETPNELETINQAVKKYNQCIVYCGQGGEDLAVIQLQKVVVAHPNFLQAQQMLGLLYLRVGKYTKARQTLRRAHKIDNTNPQTLRYLKELRHLRSVKNAKIKEDKEDTVTYNLGNETIIQPANHGLKENARARTLVNIIIGVLVGATVIWFLIVPAANQVRNSQVNQDVLKYTDEIASQKAEISALKQELEDYRLSKSEASTMKEIGEATAESYETILAVYDQWGNQTHSNIDMANSLRSVNKASLGPQGLELYGMLEENILIPVLERQFLNASESFDLANYQDVIDALEIVMEVDSTYRDGDVLLLNGKALAALGKVDDAKASFDMVISTFPDTDNATAAQEALNTLG